MGRAGAEEKRKRGITSDMGCASGVRRKGKEGCTEQSVCRKCHAAHPDPLRDAGGGDTGKECVEQLLQDSDADLGQAHGKGDGLGGQGK